MHETMEKCAFFMLEKLKSSQTSFINLKKKKTENSMINFDSKFNLFK